jgi:hypothetical protein
LGEFRHCGILSLLLFASRALKPISSVGDLRLFGWFVSICLSFVASDSLSEYDTALLEAKDSFS